MREGIQEFEESYDATILRNCFPWYAKLCAVTQQSPVAYVMC